MNSLFHMAGHDANSKHCLHDGCCKSSVARSGGTAKGFTFAWLEPRAVTICKSHESDSEALKARFARKYIFEPRGPLRGL